MEVLKTVSNNPANIVRFMRHEGKTLKFIYSANRSSGADNHVGAYIITNTGWHELVAHGDFQRPDEVYAPENIHNEVAFQAATKSRAEVLFSLMEDHIIMLFSKESGFSMFD